MAQPTEHARFWQLLLAAELPSAKWAALRGSLPDGLSEPEAIARLQSWHGLSEAEKTRMDRSRAEPLAAALRAGAMVLRAEDVAEPFADFAPHVSAMFVLGDAAALAGSSVGIVGTRGASAYGKACAIKFAEALADAGATVLSGGAFGIDAAAHKGALDAGGRTVAVLPCGIDQVYPASHRSLFESIRVRGCLVSQFACGMGVRHDTFLTRNALIAALSDVLLVVEAPESSGSLHTAHRANEMGKPVYVVPGNISQVTFRGSHNLIRHGATLVDHPDQILEDLHLMGGSRRAVADEASNPAQAAILALLGAEPISPERIAVETEFEPSAVMAELTMLELDGRIIRGAGGVTLAP